MPIKIKAPDKWFSLCVRERAEWTCERCRKLCPDDKKMGLHCAHYQSRGNWSTRFDKDNAAALCYGCHSYIDREPEYKTFWFEQYLGEGLAEIIRVKSKQPAYGIKKRVKEISRHYREQHKLMLEKRANGVTGRIEFEGY